MLRRALSTISLLSWLNDRSSRSLWHVLTKVALKALREVPLDWYHCVSGVIPDPPISIPQVKSEEVAEDLHCNWNKVGLLFWAFLTGLSRTISFWSVGVSALSTVLSMRIKIVRLLARFGSTTLISSLCPDKFILFWTCPKNKQCCCYKYVVMRPVRTWVGETCWHTLRICMDAGGTYMPRAPVISYGIGWCVFCASTNC